MILGAQVHRMRNSIGLCCTLSALAIPVFDHSPLYRKCLDLRRGCLYLYVLRQVCFDIHVLQYDQICLISSALIWLPPVDCHYYMRAHDAIFDICFSHMTDFFDMISPLPIT